MPWWQRTDKEFKLEAQHTEEETQKQLDNQQEQIQRDKPIVIPEQATPNLDQQNPTMKQTVELHKTSYENIEEFISRHGLVGLDWYVPNLSNTCETSDQRQAPHRYW